VFFAAFVFIFTLLQTSPSANQFVRHAVQDLQAGKYAEARTLLERALRYEPQNPKLWRYLGETDLRLQDIDSAITAFQKVTSLVPNKADGYFDLGVLYLKKGATSKALDACRKGLALDPDNAPANQNYAFLLMKAGRFREAVQPLTKLKAMTGANLPVRVALIESLLRCGLTRAAQSEINQFLRLPSVTASDEVKLANVLAEDHLLSPAQNVLQHVSDTAPEFAEAHVRLGLLLMGENRYEDAARQSGLAVQLEPASARYSMQLAQVLLKWQNYPTALAFLRAVKDRFGALPDYQYKLAWAQYGLHQVPEAAAVLERLVQQHPDLDLAHYSLGNCYLALSRLNDAERQYQAAIRLNPRRESYVAALGQVLRKEGDGKIDDAITNLDKALRLNPNDSQSEIQLALCYEAKGDFSQAQQILQHVVKSQPGLLAAHRILARVYYQEGFKTQGDRETAIVARLDSEQLRRRARLLDSGDNPSF
jgi:tetratricopeptide (TPR) repeat protein